MRVAGSKEREALLERFAGAATAGQARPIRSVRRPLRPRDVDGRDRAARAGRRDILPSAEFQRELGNELAAGWAARRR